MAEATSVAPASNRNARIAVRVYPLLNGNYLGAITVTPIPTSPPGGTETPTAGTYT